MSAYMHTIHKIHIRKHAYEKKPSHTYTYGCIHAHTDTYMHTHSQRMATTFGCSNTSKIHMYKYNRHTYILIRMHTYAPYITYTNE